jgi:hypothetical protein
VSRRCLAPWALLRFDNGRTATIDLGDGLRSSLLVDPVTPARCRVEWRTLPSGRVLIVALRLRPEPLPGCHVWEEARAAALDVLPGVRP